MKVKMPQLVILDVVHCYECGEWIEREEAVEVDSSIFAFQAEVRRSCHSLENLCFNSYLFMRAIIVLLHIFSKS